MGANYIEMPVDGTGKKVQTWDNTISGNDVHTEAHVATDTTGTPLGTESNPTVAALGDGTNGPAAIKPPNTAATAADKALVVTEPGSVTVGEPANTTITSTVGVVLPANPARREVIITNTDVVPVYLAFSQTPTAVAYHAALSPCSVAHDGTGGVYISDLFKGAISAIVASTSGHVSVVELT